MEDKITVLFPGGFKPITPAHIAKINELLSIDNINKIVLFIGHDTRDGINRENAIHIIKNILCIDNVEIFESNIPSPVLQCYEYMKEQTDGTYTLYSSQKDDLKRVPNFIEKHKKGGKFNHDNINAVYLNESIYNIIKHNNCNVSATILRDAFINCNYDVFYEYYKDIDNEVKETLFKYLKHILCQQPEVT